jgi:hypothetical protein
MHIKTIEDNSLEANGKLEKKLKEFEECQKHQINTLQNKNTSLQIAARIRVAPSCPSAKDTLGL